MFIPNKWKISCGLRADFSVMGWVQLASGPEKCGAAVEAGWGDHGEPQYSILCWRTNGSLQRFLGRCIPRNQPMSCKWGFFEMLSVYIYFFKSRQGSKAARQRFSWILNKNLSFFLRWNEPHHFRASTSIEDDGAISEKEKTCAAAEGGGFGILRCLEPSKNPGFWSSAHEESLENWPKFSWIILGLSWYLNLFDLLLLFFALHILHPPKPSFVDTPQRPPPKIARSITLAARVEWLDAVVSLGWRWCRDGGGPMKLRLSSMPKQRVIHCKRMSLKWGTSKNPVKMES